MLLRMRAGVEERGTGPALPQRCDKVLCVPWERAIIERERVVTLTRVGAQRKSGARRGGSAAALAQRTEPGG